MNSNIQTFFKTVKGAKTLTFGLKAPGHFNYVHFNAEADAFLDNSVSLFKQMTDSYVIEISRDSRTSIIIPELKLSNQEILTWEDHWISTKDNSLVDPCIQSLNLQKNKLVHANLNLHRAELTHLNLEGNGNMRAVVISSAPKLEVLNISNCAALGVVNLGNNRSLKALLARNCNLTPIAQERLLRDFRPTITSSSNESFVMFRKTYETLVDLRGSEIDWSNRKIASKIRMLLCNNWLVLWDNAPPVSVVPPHMYAFFTNSLEDSLIKDYYNNR
jgi:hypothetical protein